ncbi:MAG: hypothetical protein FWE90_06050 [Defluviitaleaceae bacterium]|nr:hypothetical protein [Defluviitaleaceae bacterium]
MKKLIGIFIVMVMVLGFGMNVYASSNQQSTHIFTGKPGASWCFENHVDSLTRYGMTRQYESENFAFYSIPALAVWLPYQAKVLEEAYQEFIELFGFELSQKVHVWYFYRPHYQQEFGFWHPDNDNNYVGTLNAGAGGTHAIVHSRPHGSGPILEVTEATLVHELAHVYQLYLNPMYFQTEDWDARDNSDLLYWVVEGTADFLMYGYGNWRGHPGVIHLMREIIYGAGIPSLNEMEPINKQEFYDGGGVYYLLGASMVAFISDTWGFDTVIELNRRHGGYYRRLLGITRNEFERRWHEWVMFEYCMHNNNQTQIKKILDTDYVVQTNEHTAETDIGTFHWQFVDVQNTLDLSRFPWSNSSAQFMPTTLGEVIIVTWPDDSTALHIDIGECNEYPGNRRHYMVNIVMAATDVSDPALIGRWDRLSTLQSLNAFTENNRHNVTTWAQDILRRRGEILHQLAFFCNGRVSATNVNGFGNTWTNNSIGGRGYEIRTIGGVDYLFVNNRGSAAPSTGTGTPWTVFIRN